MLGDNIDPVGTGQAGGTAPQSGGGGGLLGGLNPIGLALGAAGGLVNTILGKSNADRQWRREKEAMNIQLNNQKDLNAYNQQLQLDTWEKTNYSAQRDQMVKAGINPGLLYGMGGAGGGTLGQAGGGAASGGTPTQQQTQIDTTQMLAMGLQLEQQKAQIENIKADTASKRADAIKTAGVDTDEATTRIKSLTQGIENQKAIESLTKAQTYLQNIQGFVANETKSDAIEYIKWNTQRAVAEAQSAQQQANLDINTYNEKVQIIKESALGAVLHNALTRADISLKGLQGQAIKMGIWQGIQTTMQGWEGLSIQQQKNKIEEFKANIQAKYPGIWNVAGRTINEALSGWYHWTGGGQEMDEVNDKK